MGLLTNQFYPPRAPSVGYNAQDQRPARTFAIAWSADDSDNAASWDLLPALPHLADGTHYVQLIGTNAARCAQLVGTIEVLDGILVSPFALSGSNGTEVAQLVGFGPDFITTTWGIAADIAESPALLIVYT